MLASGTGFAPIKSICEAAFEKKIRRPITLYWGCRVKRDLYQLEVAESWKAPNFKFVPVLSDEKWSGRTGFVHRAVMEDFPDMTGVQVYACGAPIVVESARHAKPAIAVRCGLKFHIIAVEVGDALKPVNLLNHWGVDVGSKDDVDAAHANALKHKDKYKIRQVLPVVMQHGVYSFYMEDLDHNWWEIQYYPGLQNEDLFDFGDRFSMEDGAEVGELKELGVKTSA